MAKERSPSDVIDVYAVRPMRWRNPGEEETKSVKAGDKIKCRVAQLKQLEGTPMIDGVPGTAPLALESQDDQKAATKEFESARASRRRHVDEQVKKAASK